MPGRSKVLVTGSAGHLGEALVRVLRAAGEAVVGWDIDASPTTDIVGSITDGDCASRAMQGVGVVYHTATLHKPHVATHSKRCFVETNVAGTLTLLEAALAAGVGAFVFTSTTSVYGSALRPPADQPTVWVTEALEPVPRNIYGVTKLAAESLCELFQRQHGLPCIALRTSRFFPEGDDDAAVRAAFADANVKSNEFLYRRVDIADVVAAHQLAAERAGSIGFGRYIISATTPFRREDSAALRTTAAAVVARRIPGYRAVYDALGWRMFDGIDRVYDNAAARHALGWQPRYDFSTVVAALGRGADPRSALAREIGSKGYHAETFADGPFPLE